MSDNAETVPPLVAADDPVAEIREALSSMADAATGLVTKVYPSGAPDDFAHAMTRINGAYRDGKESVESFAVRLRETEQERDAMIEVAESANDDAEALGIALERIVREANDLSVAVRIARRALDADSVQGRLRDLAAVSRTLREALEAIQPRLERQFEGNANRREFLEQGTALNEALDIVRAALGSVRSGQTAKPGICTLMDECGLTDGHEGPCVSGELLAGQTAKPPDTHRPAEGREADEARQASDRLGQADSAGGRVKPPLPLLRDVTEAAERVSVCWFSALDCDDCADEDGWCLYHLTESKGSHDELRVALRKFADWEQAEDDLIAPVLNSACANGTHGNCIGETYIGHSEIAAVYAPCECDCHASPVPAAEASQVDHVPSHRSDELPRYIKINRLDFVIDAETLTGAEIRQLPNPAIRDDDDLWKIDPGRDDMLVRDADVVDLRGARFYSSPRFINAGAPAVEASGRNEAGVKRCPDGSFHKYGSRRCVLPIGHTGRHDYKRVSERSGEAE